MKGLFRLVLIGVILYMVIGVNLRFYDTNKAFIDYYDSLKEEGSVEFEKAMLQIRAYLDSDGYKE